MHRNRYEELTKLDLLWMSCVLLVLFVCGQCLGATPAQQRAANAACKVSTRDLSAPGEFAGSGILIIDATRGIVLTASHVVRGGDQSNVQCRWWNGESIRGRVINNNSRIDVAVIQLRKKPDGITGAELRCKPIQPRDRVLFVGYAYAKELVVRETVVRGYLGQSGVAGMASIEGMSGGPVIDTAGKVIGPLWGSGGDLAGQTAFVTVAGRKTVLTANY